MYFLRRGEGGEGEGVYKEVDGDVNMEDEQIGRKVNKVDDEGLRSPKRPTRFFVILFESFLKIQAIRIAKFLWIKFYSTFIRTPAKVQFTV